MSSFLDTALSSRGYIRVQNYENKVLLYARTDNGGAHLILNFLETKELPDAAWMESVRSYAIGQYAQTGCAQINCLTIISTSHINESMQIRNMMTPVWFIDSHTLQLIIFDNQPSDYDGIAVVVQGALDRLTAERQAWIEQQTRHGTSAYGRQRAADRKQSAVSFIKSRGICNMIMIAVNIVVFIVLSLMGSTEDVLFMATHGAMYVPWVIEANMWYTLFTSMFLHFGIQHIFNNMLVLYIVGDNLERAVGKWKYLVIYLCGGLCGNLLSMWVSLRSNDFAVSAGASGAIFAVVGALLYIVIRNKGRLEDLSSMQLLLVIACTLYCGFVNSGIDNAAHIGGLLGGFVLGVLLYRKKKFRQTV